MSTPNISKLKPSKKKEFSLQKFLSENNKLQTLKIDDKPLDWIPLSPAFVEAVGLPGFPKGYITLLRGHSNTGKSTGIYEGIVSCQTNGILPIIIDTETNLSKERIQLMGGNLEEIIYYTGKDLLQHFAVDKNRREGSIEDMFACIDYWLDLQEFGELPMDICFFIDSVGTLNCNMSIAATDKGGTDNNQWNAGAYEKAGKNILNTRIPYTRRKTKSNGEENPYTATLVAVQKIWLDVMSGAQPTVNHKGGKAFYHAARLGIHFGGVKGASTQTLKASSKGVDIEYGIQVKVAVFKNHLDGPMGGLARRGKLYSVPHGYLTATKEAENEYKKVNLAHFRNILKDESITENDIDTAKINNGLQETDEEIEKLIKSED